MLIETMPNRSLHDQVRALASKEATGLPLLCALNASSQGDHSFGNMFLPRDGFAARFSIGWRPALGRECHFAS